MPEFPDITLYIESLRPRIVGHPLLKVRLASPFVLRSVDPPIAAVEGKRISGLRRIGKQIVWQFEDDLFLVFHLMIAGRFHWKKPGAKAAGKIGLAAFDFPEATMLLTEASSKKRASLHVVQGEAKLAQFNRGGIEIL
ncbi:MAG TPA: DNA-formamidopyrimidine glycosylase family protein, partial [Terriglobia bacterium]|nr:DNA-formamidopyrimidine glycosylase family protein [Terriglobia bacterium]